MLPIQARGAVDYEIVPRKELFLALYCTLFSQEGEEDMHEHVLLHCQNRQISSLCFPSLQHHRLCLFPMGCLVLCFTTMLLPLCYWGGWADVIGLFLVPLIRPPLLTVSVSVAYVYARQPKSLV